MEGSSRQSGIPVANTNAMVPSPNANGQENTVSTQYTL
jgi:hypothetical protein